MLERAYEIDQPFAGSLSLSDGLESAPRLAYALNGEPLTRPLGPVGVLETGPPG